MGLLFVLLAGPAVAQEDERVGEEGAVDKGAAKAEAAQDTGDAPGRMDTRGQRPSRSELDDLAEVARRHGSVRVIAGLRMAFVPEGALSDADADAQREVIASEGAVLRRDLERAAGRVLRTYETVPYIALELPERAVEALGRSDHVASVQHDVPVPPALAQSSPLVEAQAMWDAGHDGAGFMVAVLDTGVDTAHAFFGGRVTEEACYSTTSAADGSTTLCPNGQSSQTGVGAGVACTGIGGCDHGTHVAGIAAGSGGSFSGVARAANIMAVQVFSEFNNDTLCGAGESPCVLSYPSDQLAGLDRVHTLRNTHTFAAANMSLGGGSNSTACDADSRKAVIDNLRSVNIATVIATGNNGFTNAVGAPACISTAVAVGSTTKDDEVSSFSNGHATLVDLLAPGSSINSAVPGGGFASFNGTSMATPQVAGAWALMRDHTPAASVAEILAELKDTGVPVTDNRVGAGYTHPRIRIFQAAFGIPLAPTNDDFADATVIALLPYTRTQDTTGATVEMDEPPACATSGGTTGATVWFRYTSPVDQMLTADTFGSGFDTVLAAYTGASLGTLSEVACNDDHPGSGLLSQVEFAATAGETYHFQVGGWNGDSGMLTFNLSGDGPIGPPNDDFASAAMVSELPYTDSQNTFDATTETGEPNDPSCHVGGIGRTVWYRYEAGATVDLAADTDGANFDTFLVAYRQDGSGFAGLTEVACDEGTATGDFSNSMIELTVEAGQTYYFQVGGWAPAPGDPGFAGALVFNLAEVDTGPTPPDAPTAVTATAGNAQASVTWTPPASDGGSPITGYTVTAAPGGQTATVGGATTTATVTGLTNGTSYTFTVRATNAVGQGLASAPSNAVTPMATVPGAPTGVTAVAGDASATLTWTPPADGGSPIIGYEVSSSPGGVLGEVGNVGSIEIIELNNGTTYTFTLRAINAVGTGPASSPSNAVTPMAPAAVPGAPTGVSATAGDAQASVSWTPPADGGSSVITGYTVTASPGGQTASVGGSATQATVTGLTNGTSYTFTVRATNAAGTGPASSPSNAVTPSAPVSPGAELPGFDGDPATTQRINRTEGTSAAIMVSGLRFPDGGQTASHVVLSRDDAFPDSLAGASLTGDGPLLFTNSQSLTATTGSEIDRLLSAGDTVYLLGGPEAISPAVQSALEQRGYQVRRLAGESRVETAIAVADEVRRLNPSVTAVAVARAFSGDSPTAGWADSVTGGGYGASAGVPILVTPTGSVHPAVAAWLAADAPSRTILLGGTAALSDAVAAGVPNPQRVAGEERQETAVRIATELWRSPTSGARRFSVINGRHTQGWMFGLAVGGIAADADAPVLLVGPDIQPAVAGLVGACGPPQVDLLLMGDTSVISEDLRTQLDTLDGGAC